MNRRACFRRTAPHPGEGGHIFDLRHIYWKENNPGGRSMKNNQPKLQQMLNDKRVITAYLGE